MSLTIENENLLTVEQLTLLLALRILLEITIDFVISEFLIDE